jgi:hypothetical protein
MPLLRAAGGLYLLLSLYYGRFFVERQEPTTLIQLVTLWCAAAWLLLHAEPPAAGSVWFRGWQPTAWQGWAVVAIAVGMAVAVFVVIDRDAHSVSDTFNRIAPTFALLSALVLRLRFEHIHSGSQSS